MALFEKRRKSMPETTGKYPNAFYRVSIKAIIRNERGEVLLVKEDGGSWSLPGGGMDHGETAEVALARELYEEALITESFEAQLIGTWPFYVQEKEAWLLWLVYEIQFEKPFLFGKGADADEVAFMNPRAFKDATIRSEKLVYKWCVDQNATLE